MTARNALHSIDVNTLKEYREDVESWFLTYLFTYPIWYTATKDLWAG